MTRIHNESGMTLVEMLVSIGLLTILLLATWSMTALGVRAFNRDEGNLASVVGQRRAVMRITGDVRGATTVTIADSGRELRAVLANGRTAIYRSDASGNLLRTESGSAAVTVARGAGTMTFALEQRSRPSGGAWQVVTINAVAPAGQTLTVRVTVRRP